MFHVSENHITLSGMADTKSNIMISINSIILSVVISVLFRKLEEFPNLLIPTLMHGGYLFDLITIVFCNPGYASEYFFEKFTREDIKKTHQPVVLRKLSRHGTPAIYDWGMRAK